MDMKAFVKNRPLLCIMRNIPLEKTVDYARAVIDGGVNFFEVALNTPYALKQLELLCTQLGSYAVFGAGTVCTTSLAESALAAGAQFLLSPCTSEDVLSYCDKNNVYFLPGALTPSDVALCLRYNFKTIKLFPAGDMPRGYIKSLKGPFDQTEYVAIGGVTPKTINTFFDDGYISVGLGSNMMPKDIVDTEDWSAGVKYVSNLLATIKTRRY